MGGVVGVSVKANPGAFLSCTGVVTSGLWSEMWERLGGGEGNLLFLSRTHFIPSVICMG